MARYASSILSSCATISFTCREGLTKIHSAKTIFLAHIRRCPTSDAFKLNIARYNSNDAQSKHRPNIVQSSIMSFKLCRNLLPARSPLWLTNLRDKGAKKGCSCQEQEDAVNLHQQGEKRAAGCVRCSENEKQFASECSQSHTGKWD